MTPTMAEVLAIFDCRELPVAVCFSAFFSIMHFAPLEAWAVFGQGDYISAGGLPPASCGGKWLRNAASIRRVSPKSEVPSRVNDEQTSITRRGRALARTRI